MRTIEFTGYGTPEVLQLRIVTKPVVKEDELLVRIYATAVTTADCISRKGDPFIARIGSGLRKPNSVGFGNLLAGKVERIGGNVKRFRVGDEVFGLSGNMPGAYADYISLPEEAPVIKKPVNMSYAEAVSLCSGELTALHFLRDKAKIKSGDRILINGASGSIGVAAVQLAKYFGAEVTGVCSTTNVELVKNLGADKVVDYTREDFTQHSQKYNVVFDAVGKSSFSRCKDSLLSGGTYLTTVPSLAIMFQMMWTSKIGSRRATMGFAGLRAPDKKANDLIFLKELIESDVLKPVIDRHYLLEQAAEAHRYVEKGHKIGNVVLTLTDSNTPLK
ncbi:MAG: NAD(P)-dependent alcohol dehydrogenase [Calditrichia bacterium]